MIRTTNHTLRFYFQSQIRIIYYFHVRVMRDFIREKYSDKELSDN
jgi:hypothetical protein